jgi:pyruvate dehydrogenase E1 component alpha subunit
MDCVTAGGDIAARAGMYAMPSKKIDGNSIARVVDAASEAIGYAREAPGPAFLEFLTYRHLGHSKSDPAKYRSDEEHAAWLDRDPIDLEKSRLLAEGGADDDKLAALSEDVQRELGGAIDRALAAPMASPATDQASEYAP